MQRETHVCAFIGTAKVFTNIFVIAKTLASKKSGQDADASVACLAALSTRPKTEGGAWKGKKLTCFSRWRQAGISLAIAGAHV